MTFPQILMKLVEIQYMGCHVIMTLDSGFESIQYLQSTVVKMGKTLCWSKRLGLLGVPDDLVDVLGHFLVLHDRFEDFVRCRPST